MKNKLMKIRSLEDLFRTVEKGRTVFRIRFSPLIGYQMTICPTSAESYAVTGLAKKQEYTKQQISAPDGPLVKYINSGMVWTQQ